MKRHGLIRRSKDPLYTEGWVLRFMKTYGGIPLG
jgi:hypothetical protein